MTAPAPGQRARAWRAALAVAAIVVAVDQATKAAVIAEIEPGERVGLGLGVDFVHVTNRGIAFGLLGDGGGIVLAITAGALAMVLVWFARDPSRPGLWLAVGLLAGGALGNLADRVRSDAVTDFLDLPLWPAFNLADVAITAGALTLVLAAFADGDREEATAASDPRAGPRA